jgi:hypothetical protein
VGTVVGATVVGRRVFDMTDGWDGIPPGGVDHVLVVTHRPPPESWNPEAPFSFVGGQVFASGLVDEVRMDVIPVVLGSGKRYFGSVSALHVLDDPIDLIPGTGVLHLRYRLKV